MDQDRFSFRNLAINYLCLYAILYPLLAHILMEEGGTGGVGSVPVHFLQLSAFIAFFGISKLGSESLRSGVDVWIVASFYFICEALYLAVFFAEDAKIVEIAYAARFIMWFLFATIITRQSLEIRQLEKLAFSFLIGIFIQELLAMWAFNTQNVGSIYKEVYATTGGVNVSGKTVVSFVTLGIFLAFYWLVVTRRGRWIFAIPIFVGLLVILFSYNRATQLSFALVLLFDAFWLFRGRKIRTFFILGIAIIAAWVFLTSSFGESFLLRWQRIRVDGGNGRIKLIRAALGALVNPESMRSLLFGRGYSETRLLMFRACGDYVGTHSDLFDFLTMYGIVGGGFYAWIAFRILTIGRNLPRRSLEYLCVQSVGAFIILTGLMTGSFQSTYTYVMFFTICQYWLEKGAFLYGIGTPLPSGGTVPFFSESESDSGEFQGFFRSPGEYDDFADPGRNLYGEDEDEGYKNNSVGEERSILDSDNCSNAYDEEDVDSDGETIDSHADFRTIYSVTDPAFGRYSPFIAVDVQSQNNASDSFKKQNPPLDNIQRHDVSDREQTGDDSSGQSF